MTATMEDIMYIYTNIIKEAQEFQWKFQQIINEYEKGENILELCKKYGFEGDEDIIIEGLSQYYWNMS